MNLSRALRHLASTGWGLRRAFDAEAMAEIEQAIQETESLHGGEVRFAIEDNLSMRELWRDLSPRDRALDVFARLGVWDTKLNNGVLIYVLWADRDVEIVADRGLSAAVANQEWQKVCERMERLFAERRAREAVVEGIRAVGTLIAKEFPATDGNELPNSPVRL